MGHVYIANHDLNAKTFGKSIRIANHLKREGISIWIAELNVKGGQDFAEEIAKAASKADAKIYIVDMPPGSKIRINAGTEDIPILILTEHAIEVIITSDQDYDLLYLDDENLIPKVIQKLPKSVKEESDQLRSEQISEKTPSIFISYASEDTKFVEKLRNFFGNKGYGFWDFQKSPRRYDLPFHLELEDAITRSSAVVSVVSPDWKYSRWTSKEYLFTQQIGKANFVCMVREVDPTLLISDVTHIEFHKDEAKAFMQLDEALRREGLID